jgi:hypothetical protein
MMMGSEPAGKAGTTHPAAARPQGTWTSVSSKRNDRPMRETKAMIHFSSFG